MFTTCIVQIQLPKKASDQLSMDVDNRRQTLSVNFITLLVRHNHSVPEHYTWQDIMFIHGVTLSL